MAEMVNMKQSHASGSQPVDMDREEYPYGLRLHLGNDELDKLGMESLPQVGQTLIVQARVKVDSVSQTEREGDDANRNVGLQITDMVLAPDIKPVDAADQLYGDGNK